MSNRGSEFLRLSVDLPRRDAEAATHLLGGLSATQNLSIEPISYDHNAALSPGSLFTMLEEPDSLRLIPAVLRAHLQYFEGQDDTWVQKGFAERFTNGLWRRGVSTRVIPRTDQSRALSPNVILADKGRIAAIHANRTSHLHELLDTKQVMLMGVGEATIDWFGEFSEAVGTQLAAAS